MITNHPFPLLKHYPEISDSDIALCSYIESMFDGFEKQKVISILSKIVKSLQNSDEDTINYYINGQELPTLDDKINLQNYKIESLKSLVDEIYKDVDYLNTKPVRRTCGSQLID